MTKLKSTGRFGARYSTPLKNVVRDIESVQKAKHPCPQCGKTAVKRKGYAVWECRSCGTKFAGGAYQPQTDVGAMAERIVRKGEKVPLAEEAGGAKAELKE